MVNNYNHFNKNKLMSFSSSSSGSYIQTCKSITTSSINYCAPYINYEIPSSLNEKSADDLAVYQSSSSSECPQYLTNNYLCAKYFPECIIVNSNVRIAKLCINSCMKAKYTECRHYAESYFTSECSNGEYYSNDLYCKEYDFGVSDEFDSSIYWKIGLGLALFVLSLIVLYCWYKQRKRDNMSIEELDVEQAMKQSKQIELQRKQRLKQGIEGEQYENIHLDEIDKKPINGAELARARIEAKLAAEREGRPNNNSNNNNNNDNVVEGLPHNRYIGTIVLPQEENN